MTHDEVFLHDILAQPDEDAPRLIYADWLEDNGDPDRAEFIRAQCTEARLSEGDPRRTELTLVANQLLTKNWNTWLSGLRALLRDRPYGSHGGEGWVMGPWTPEAVRKFTRGFVEACTLDAVKFVQQPDRLFALAPVRHLRLWGAGRVPAALPRVSQLAFLETLDFIDYYLDPVTAHGARLLAESPYLGGLKALHLYRNNIGDAGLEALASAPWFGGLRILTLNDNGLSEVGVRALARIPQPLCLARLFLNSNPIGDQGTAALAESPTLAGLEALFLSHCGLTNAGLEALARSPHLKRLRLLELQGNSFTAANLSSLVGWPTVFRQALRGVLPGEQEGGTIP
jgi:uncharacterized protein (TIGR02996 family)